MGFIFKDQAFGKNDLRGIVGETITPELFEFVGKAYAKYIIQKSPSDKDIWISVAQDARLHSPELTKVLIDGLLSSGINVIDIGLCPTPLAYFSEYMDLGISGSLIVTASHNPSEYNGLKMTYNKSTLSEQNICELREITRKLVNDNSPQESAKKGVYKKHNIIPDYINFMLDKFPQGIGKGLKIVVDSGNATAGVVAPDLYRKLGCEVIDIFTEPDGDFPNHHPNPSDEKTLKALKEKIKEHKADFGIAFDGDSDRVGIVDNTGYSLPGDQLLLIFALDILKQQDYSKAEKKPVFISEVKCSQVLFDEIEKHNGSAIMWKTGHAFIKSKMREEKALLAGEMSGHIFFNDLYYGFDDAIYAGCRFIEVVAKNKSNNPDFVASTLVKNLPQVFTSREVRLSCPNELKQEVITNLAQKLDKDPSLFGSKIEKIITIDGLRLVFNDGFALIRASNTEPTFTLRFESASQENLENYQNTMIKLVEEDLCQLTIR